ncbi:MAG TPA: hypothetical protein VF587_19330 [Solirubrobacteraceae bacterium]
MRLRPHLTYANVVSTACLFIVLGGVSYAAATLPRNSVGAKQLKRNAVTSAKVKNGSLRAADFRASDLPGGARGAQGERGPAGPAGPMGPIGPEGPVDPSRFLAADGKAADADKVDGIDSDLLLLGPLIRRAQASRMAPPNSRDGGTATCGAGEIAVSGGAAWDTAPNDWPIVESAPDTNGGWVVTVYNGDASEQGWYPVALCAGLG